MGVFKYSKYGEDNERYYSSFKLLNLPISSKSKAILTSLKKEESDTNAQFLAEFTYLLLDDYNHKRNGKVFRNLKQYKQDRALFVKYFDLIDNVCALYSENKIGEIVSIAFDYRKERAKILANNKEMERQL
ncbi:MAG: hypothetical protein ACI4TX_04335 [Christensenellales bacterium]